MKRSRLDVRTADALLSGRAVDGEPALAGLVGELRALADQPAPAPSSALAAMLEDGFVPDPVAVLPVRRAVTWTRYVRPVPFALSLTAVLALVLGAAAGNDLPAPAQTAVADVVEAVTPLHVPRPAPHVPVWVAPTTSPSPHPTSEDHEDASPGPSPSQHERGQDESQPGGQDGTQDGTQDGSRDGRQDAPQPRSSRGTGTSGDEGTSRDEGTSGKGSPGGSGDDKSDSSSSSGPSEGSGRDGHASDHAE